MRHAVLALPLLALAAACAEPCTAPALTAAWRFDLAGGVRAASCHEAGVATVSLWLDGAAAGLDMDCEQGAATFTGLAAGAHDYTIQGHDAAGALRYQEWGAVEVGGCGETRAQLRPGAGVLHLSYDTVTGLCYPAGDPAQTSGYIWFHLKDASTGATAAAITSTSSSADKIRIPCGPAVAITLPYGLYELSWIQDVALPLSSQPCPIYQECVPRAVTVRSQGVTSLPVMMVASDCVTCPQ